MEQLPWLLSGKQNPGLPTQGRSEGSTGRGQARRPFPLASWGCFGLSRTVRHVVLGEDRRGGLGHQCPCEQEGCISRPCRPSQPCRNPRGSELPPNRRWHRCPVILGVMCSGKAVPCLETASASPSVTKEVRLGGAPGPLLCCQAAAMLPGGLSLAMRTCRAVASPKASVWRPPRAGTTRRRGPWEVSLPSLRAPLLP